MEESSNEAHVEQAPSQSAVHSGNLSSPDKATCQQDNTLCTDSQSGYSSSSTSSDSSCNNAAAARPTENEEQVPQRSFNTSRETSSDEREVSLDTLPLELLMHICSYVDAHHIVHTLSHVSQGFHDILNVESYWKSRVLTRWPKTYPPVFVTDFDWKAACLAREDLYNFWMNVEDKAERIQYTYGISACVDTVHLMQNGGLLAVGSRNKCLSVIDTSRLSSEDTEQQQKGACLKTIPTAHQGWVWSLASVEEKLISGGWDRYIRIWDMREDCAITSEFKCNSAVLSLYVEPNAIFAGCYDKSMYSMDPREGKVTKWPLHRQAVLCIAGDENCIITGSEDGTVGVFDRRTNSVIQTIKNNQEDFQCTNTFRRYFQQFDWQSLLTKLSSYPLCCSYGNKQLWLGDRRGLLHLYDCNQQLLHPVLQDYDVGHKSKIMGIQHTLGALYTCSADKTIHLLEPSLNPSVMATLTMDSELPSLSVENGVLAAACSSGAVALWKPKTRPGVKTEHSHTGDTQCDLHSVSDHPSEGDDRHHDAER